MIVDKNSLVPNGFGLYSRASFVITANNKNDIKDASDFAYNLGLPFLTIGSGTNIAPEGYLEAVVLLPKLKGVRYGEEIKIEAGEQWDDIVAQIVNKGYSGIEPLSGIPGSVGAAPVQNIGAYGSELSQVIESVEVYDRKKDNFIFLSKKECAFGYRNSVFKMNPGRFVILSVYLKLQKLPPKIPEYADVKKYFEERNVHLPSASDIRKAVIDIRKNKLPDYKIYPNCGSFFKNPIISKNVFQKLKKQFPSLPVFGNGDEFKVSAGFLIEKAGFKGKEINGFFVYEKNALVLTNPNGANFSSLIAAKNKIQKRIFEMFNINLEPEVNIIV